VNSYEERYYKQMLKETECVMNLSHEVQGRMIDQEYDIAIERCYDIIRSLRHMKKLNMEKRAVDMLCFAAKNVLGGQK
jgi:hypothetical protein